MGGVATADVVRVGTFPPILEQIKEVQIIK